MFTWQICGYLPFVISHRSTSTAFRIFNIYRDMLLIHVQESNLPIHSWHEKRPAKAGRLSEKQCYNHFPFSGMIP
nr:MAG TPA: hypothetical protein [Caudoviricetes sp.]